MATYASVQDLQDHLGAHRLAGLLSVEDPTEHGSHATKLLESATEEMDSAFGRAGYVTPITPTGNLVSRLIVVCVSLAARNLDPGLVDEPSGIRLAADKAERWLKALVSGEEVLVGVDKSVTVTVSARRGILAFEPTGSRNLPVNLFPSSTLYAGSRVDE